MYINTHIYIYISIFTCTYIYTYTNIYTYVYKNIVSSAGNRDREDHGSVFCNKMREINPGKNGTYKTV